MLRMFLQSVKINDKNVLQSLIRYKITILAEKIWNYKDVGKNVPIWVVITMLRS
jgi:hypothetical protein